MKPAQAIFLGFFLAICLGTVLLALPAATESGESAGFVTALFTSTSAVCVTGLIVVDTPAYWSGFGEAVILALIQLGGTGVMTFATVIGLSVLRKLSLRTKLIAAAEAKSVGLEDVRSVVTGIVKISLGVELVLATILVLRFWLTHEYEFGEALWLGTFHSISAFNNAGFSLFSDSIMGFVTDPVISLSMAAAVILGGLGFPVLVQLRRHFRQPRLWSMHTRIVVVGTVVLLTLGTALVTIIEWANPHTLGPLNWHQKLVAGFFQSVQTRTAGFNSIDTSELDPATWLGLDVLMLIGGGPAGTAGGIKITTFAVLLFIILAELRGEGAVNVFGKRLSRSVHRQAITVVLLALALIIASTAVLMLISGFSLDRVLFETISAFATVGLSTGITGDLPQAGQLMLVVLMFIGRIGPITFASVLALRERRTLYELPKERPIIG